MNRPSSTPQVFRQAELPSRSRGGNVSTVPLATTSRGATTFLNGITKFGAGTAIDHHVHNTVESVMIIKGEAIVDIDGERTHLATFDTTLVPANIPHHFENASATDEMWIIWTYGSIDATRTILATGARGRVDAEDPGSEQTNERALVHEIAEIDVIPGQEAEFEAAVASAAPLFQAARGARTFRLERSVEHPARYRLVVGWETLDDHLVRFRESAGFAEWRRLAGPYFAAPPRVEHVHNVLTAF